MAEDQNNIDSTEVGATNKSLKQTLPPPIFIANKNLDLILLRESLINLVGENGFLCQTNQKNLKFQANTSDGYRSIIKFLNT